ncbi:MAG: YihA family ribosome biogenesis GTP-binding protein [Tenericutes bacterium]|nr:MAG: YihA family ribosome biogenesis GTP-binding protein [Mycoplasmatota bacterium]
MLKNVKYIRTTHLVSELPVDDKKEIVIVGRSNVGKSTFINVLTNNKKMAHISSKPGKTRAISIFDVDGRYRLVDLPGYGFAKVSKRQLRSFSAIIDTYLTERENISMVIVLLDARRGVTPDDQEMFDYLIHSEIPFQIVGTKLDKVNQSELHSFKKDTAAKLGIEPIIYSSVTKKNLDNVELLIESSV